ncbi:MAG: hypothetical protein LBC60_05585 [Spirochaetaceae bacterium]|jgi:hypothetical protein|nr:hypothetical protein [Spirochaetaceae bacterium]
MKRYIPILFLLFFFRGTLSAQNVVFIQGEGNFFPPAIGGPSWVGGGAGINLLLYKTLIQDDIILSLGTITALDASENLERKLLLKVSDNLFAMYNINPVISLRGGITAGLGVYSGAIINGFLNIGLLLGVHILPESPISFTVDIQPGYGLAFFAAFFTEKPFTPRHHGWVFPATVGVRLNLDKLK